ncbi:MAG: L-lactate permease [Actinomycetaceae bacterium]|nr:L-lactate permease [Actinomycetaceae bacterium]
MTTFTPTTDPVAGSLFLSALSGILPLAVFFVLLGVFKIKTHWCAIISLLVALAVAIFGFKMPTTLALLSASQGIAFGFFPILYIIIAAVWLYNLTEKSGRSADVRAAFNVVGKGDQRAQGLLIAFSFCGLLEGLAGFGAPVAIVGAMLVTIGINPIKAALATIVGNAINVGFGAMAIPVTTAGKLGGTQPTEVAWVMGHLTPYIGAIVPLILLVILDGLRGMKQLWPAALVSGFVTALGHLWCASYFSYELTAVVASLLGFIALTAVLQVWSPKTPEDCRSTKAESINVSRAVIALLPYWLVVIVFAVAKLWTLGINIPEALASTDLKFGWPGLHGHLVNTAGEATNATLFTLQWLSSPGTLLALTAIVVTFVYASTSSNNLFPFSVKQGFSTLIATIVELRIAILTIAVVMGLAYVMNLSGQTVSIGEWMAGAGAGFAFVSPVLGWLGTAVAGSATSANALFAKLQATAAAQVHVDPNILLASNTIGGGLGKIVSPQNLAIVSGAVGQLNSEPLLLRKVGPISIGLLIILSVLTGLASFGLMPGIG